MYKKISKHKRNKIISDVISNFMQGRYAPEEMDSVRGLFVSWFEADQDADIKDKYLLQILKLDKEEPEDLIRIDRMLKEYKRRMNFVENEEKTTEVRRSISLGRQMMRVAAVVLPLLIVAGGFWYFSRDVATESIEFTIANSKIEKVILPDNTEVWINSDSNLKFTESNDKHRVAELTGEGFFKVTKNRERPFTVTVGQVNVTVLGTEFNVGAYPDRGITVVTLIEGSVKIGSEAGGKWNLMPGERFIYDKLKNEGRVIAVSEKELTRVSEWRDGKLIFNDITPLEMLRMVERKFDVTVEIDPALYFSDEQIYVEFQPDDSLEFIMKYIKMFENDSFNYVIAGKNVKIVSHDR